MAQQLHMTWNCQYRTFNYCFVVKLSEHNTYTTWALLGALILCWIMEPIYIVQYCAVCIDQPQALVIIIVLWTVDYVLLKRYVSTMIKLFYNINDINHQIKKGLIIVRS